MEELDLLKKAWQKDSHSFDQVSEKDIYKMLHTKSSSILKWILIISIIEVVFWAAINFCWDIDEYLKKVDAEEVMLFFKVINYISYVVIAWFIYKFYKNYIKISTTASTKQLMHDILTARRTVQNYVWFNLGMAILSLISGFVIYFVYNPESSLLKDRIAHENNHYYLLITIGVIVLTFAILLFFIWLFYKLLYGILMRKLNANYKELKKIDL